MGTLRSRVMSAALALTVALPLPVLAQGAGSEIELLRQELRKLQERLQKLEEAQARPPAPAPSPTAAPASTATGIPVATQQPPLPPRPGETEIKLDREHPLELLGLSRPEVAGFRLSGFFSASAAYNSASHMVPEFAGGLPRLTESGALNFGQTKFSLGVAKTFAPWLSAAATMEVEQHADRHTHLVPTTAAGAARLGCPAGLACERFGAEAAETEIQLHRFNITGIVPIGNGLSVSFGRFDTPYGIERHDPNLLLTATPSEVFNFGRPNSMTGFQLAYQFTPWLDATAWIVNRWENETTHDPFDDNNRAKSLGGRIGFTPISSGGRILNFGMGGWWGEERTNDTADPRWILDFDVTWNPFPSLLLAGEFVYGGEDYVSFRARGTPFAAPPVLNKDVNWWGLYALAHYDIWDWLGVTFRYGYFRDQDAARTGVEQSLQSFTLAPVFHLSRLIPGLRPLGVTYPRTAHPLNWVDVKLEYRANRSDKEVFTNTHANQAILSGDHWNHQLQLQFVVNY